MSFTIGRGLFGDQAAGRWNFDPPDEVLYVESFPRRVRALRGGATFIDSDDVKLVYRSGALARYSFPARDVSEKAKPDPHVDGHVLVPWDAADQWFEEDEEVFVHPRDPYHRIDALATSRQVTVSLGGERLADSTAAVGLYETSLPVRWYLPASDVNADLLEPSDTVTQCAYKGTARHWSARIAGELHPDIAWGYGHAELWREGEPVAGRIAFYDEKLDISIDGQPQSRPLTPFS